ncbi:riboflavin biosynthesis protein RibD [Jeongeupia sp. HS-3]|uniref:bifunctional diaminohydroxyphosphoribosylaminopyrimidine deaminase/5-amino-6-(5-phosphoribosylamino)uracil reductase RibD n=1 Tax=Jeongeupia sp. HS-3 TaxID=1009682 RepID=UPI0018A57A41|nr:bifunctional diaminohydroxyphosphoribosylaminopyrimidine deaminase/5-amino-6-(5-phosphoribosylamino)uracil reductase RibD [Jeongeupia sp. HS-3]BCL75040.1 riboflavin biosynthesis protein RibD [Jeongeupia sp. HS-3]
MSDVPGMSDRIHMQHALRLAARGLYTTTPNPRVGCVIVKDGVVVGEGWHVRAGEPHAEVHALRMAGAAASGATAYVTLEPCSHHGRTPPCADALVQAGVARVVVAMTDPNPQVAGRGLARLRAAGIATASGVLEAEARELNVGFVSRMLRGRPWTRIKLAASLDGRIALADGQSKWITGAAARADVQRWRARSCAMLTGVNTVLADGAQLTVRDFDVERQPLRVVVDSALRTPVTARLLQAPGVLIAGASDGVNRAALEAAGAEVLLLPGSDGRVDLAALLLHLGGRGINELTVEAGGVLAGALLQAGLADELLLYQAPVLIGQGKPMADFALSSLTERFAPRVIERRSVGDDLRWTLRFTDPAQAFTGSIAENGQ